MPSKTRQTEVRRWHAKADSCSSPSTYSVLVRDEPPIHDSVQDHCSLMGIIHRRHRSRDVYKNTSHRGCDSSWSHDTVWYLSPENILHPIHTTVKKQTQPRRLNFYLTSTESPHFNQQLISRPFESGLWPQIMARSWNSLTCRLISKQDMRRQH